MAEHSRSCEGCAELGTRTMNELNKNLLTLAIIVVALLLAKYMKKKDDTTIQ